MEGSKLVSVLVDSGKKISMADLPVEQKKFSQFQLTEDQVEDFLDGNLDVLFAGDSEAQSLLLVGRQVRNEYSGTCDLVAIDPKGCIVAIEIKRDPEDCKTRTESFEMQAVRYASSFARIATPEELIDQVFVPYLLKYHRDDFDSQDVHDYATRKVYGFLKEKGNFNNSQRIILVASGFDPEVRSACAWLYKNNIDISCIQISPLSHDGKAYLLVDRIIPPLVLEDMLAKVVKRKIIPSDIRTDLRGEQLKRAKLPTTSEMFDEKLLSVGDTVMIKNQPESAAKIIDYKFVEYKGMQTTWNKWAKDVTGWSAVNIYANVTVASGKTLDELRGKTE